MSWPPLKKLGPPAGDCKTTGELLDRTIAGPSTYLLQYAREIIEAAIRLKCRDARLESLATGDLAVLLRFTEQDMVTLTGDLARVNDEIRRLDLDSPLEVTTILLDTQT